MSLFEWFSESYNPGPVGRIRTRRQGEERKPPKRIWIVLIAMAGQALFWFIIYLIAGQNNWSAVAIGLCVLIVYIILSFFLEPEPNYENFGWLGGFVDNPFRISDDFNRFLAFLYIILLPGKCMAYGFIFTYQIFRYNILKKSK